MSRIRLHPVPQHVLPVLASSGVRIKKYRSAASFERDLKTFLKRNEILHLSTRGKRSFRTTPVGYKLRGLTLYVFSEGGGKFANLKENSLVSFSIAEPYRVSDDFWGYKGLQGWGTARVYSKREHPQRFARLLKGMNIVIGTRTVRPEDIAPQFNHKIIEITPDRITYTNPREGVFKVTWRR